jgi:hypothetical protein
MYVYIDIILIICIVPSYSNVQVFDWVPISGPAIVSGQWPILVHSILLVNLKRD